MRNRPAFPTLPNLSPSSKWPLLCLLGAAVYLAGGAARGQQAAAAAAQTPAEYVGSETCAACHDEISTGFQKNKHATLETDKRRRWEGKACESCHGPGSKHAESTEAADILNPLKLSAPQSEKLCLDCHKNTMTQVGRMQGGHGRNAVPCTGCHNVHATGADSSHLIHRSKARTNQQCAGCHPNVMAAFQKPHAHRVREGAMSCLDCHNPHASFLNRNLRLVNANEPNCFRCHSNKRGPFVFEHAPMRNEPCTICHEPHGSANPKMLTRAEVYLQCLECHSNLQSPAPRTGVIGGVPPAFHNLNSARIRNCTICHTKIHGSHVSKGLLR